jgi:hypothetical protein
MEEQKIEEQTSAQIIEKMKEVHDNATILMESIIDMFGEGVIAPRLAYSRQLAMEHLEDTMFRVNEGAQWACQQAPDVREKMAEQALKNVSVPNLTVVDGGKA